MEDGDHYRVGHYYEMPKGDHPQFRMSLVEFAPLACWRSSANNFFTATIISAQAGTLEVTVTSPEGVVKNGMGGAGDMFMILKGSSFQVENHSLTQPCSITLTSIIPVNANDADLNANAADVEEETGQNEQDEDDDQQGGALNRLFDGRTKLHTLSGSFDLALGIASNSRRVLIVCIEDDALPSFNFNRDVLCDKSVQAVFQDRVFLWQQVCNL
jgi:hypothetical protein